MYQLQLLNCFRAYLKSLTDDSSQDLVNLKTAVNSTYYNNLAILESEQYHMDEMKYLLARLYSFCGEIKTHSSHPSTIEDIIAPLGDVLLYKNTDWYTKYNTVDIIGAQLAFQITLHPNLHQFAEPLFDFLSTLKIFCLKLSDEIRIKRAVDLSVVQSLIFINNYTNK